MKLSTVTQITKGTKKSEKTSLVYGGRKMREPKKAEKNDTDTHEKLLDYEELSLATGLSVSLLQKAKWRYQLPYYKIGALVRFKLSEVDAWIRQRRVTG